MKFLINLFLGVIFGFGLIFSDIFNPEIVVLAVPNSRDWNTSLLFTIFSIIIVSIFLAVVTKTANVSKKHGSFMVKSNTLTRKNIIGAVVFGTGWGLSGLCASTAAINLVFNDWESFLFFAFMVAGFYGPKFIKKMTL